MSDAIQRVFRCSYCGNEHIQCLSLFACTNGAYICDRCVGAGCNLVRSERSVAVPVRPASRGALAKVPWSTLWSERPSTMRTTLW